MTDQPRFGMCRFLGLALVAGLYAGSAGASSRSLTLEARIDYQRRIEQVFWSHRIWPAENSTPKPDLDAVAPRPVLRAKVEDALRKSDAAARLWSRPITHDQLQAEMDRMAAGSRDPAMLRELYGALDDDPFLVAEMLARPALADRIVRSSFAGDARWRGRSFDDWWNVAAASLDVVLDPPAGAFSLPVPRNGESTCIPGGWTSTSLCCDEVPGPHAPSARWGHVAVWTGSEMIVWADQSAATNTGGRYAPSTDTWTPTSTTGAPGARKSARAVWTGTRVIVWGGIGTSGTPIDTGGRYDPASDTWTPTSTGANLPAARTEHTLVWTGTVAVVWGGVAYDFNTGTLSILLDTGGRYDPATDTWQTTRATGAPAARRGHTAVWTGTQMVVWGGLVGTSTTTNTGGRYDPSADAWSSTSTAGQAPTARFRHTAVWTGSKMVVWGGQGGVGAPPLQTGGRYDPASNHWSPTSTSGDLTAGLVDHTAVWTGSRMVIWGGSTSGVATVPTNAGSSYDPVGDAWAFTGTSGVPSSRTLHTAVWSGNEMIIWGGEDGSQAGLRTGARYNPASDAWVPTVVDGPPVVPATIPSPRVSNTTTWTGSEMLVYGGKDGQQNALASGSVYVPATDTWTRVPDNLARADHTAVWSGTQVLVWGGGIASQPGSRFDPTSGSWSAMSTLSAPAARSNHVAVWTGGLMIVWGGNNFQNTGGLYNPAFDQWGSTITSGAPSPRVGHTAVWNGDSMIVWGGRDFQARLLDTGSAYHPATNFWTTMSIGPPAMNGHTAVWTGGGMIVFGPGGAATYDPRTNGWTYPSTVGMPSPRSGHTAVWTGTEMIVWGGSDVGILGDGAKYDPASNAWTPVGSTGAPAARSGHQAVWTGSEMIVWGGSAVGTPSNSGGRYCVASCDSPSSWTPDQDGDGYGVGAGTYVPACSQPPLYSAAAGDCSDTDPSVHPGALEVCNGIDDDCNNLIDDGLPTPGPPALTIAKNGTDAYLNWTFSGGRLFDVVKGSLVALQTSLGDFTSSTSACLANDTNALTTVDTEVPAPGQGLWYLVRGWCTQQGGYDDGASSQQGSRDPEIALSPAHCP